MVGALALFFYVDYVLISLLPITKHSFGPVKVVTLMLACLRVPFAWLPAGWNLGFELAGTLLVIYGFYIEPFWVDVHHESFSSAKLKTDKPLRVLHLGDLHIERITRRETSIIEKVKALSPDLILFTGDVHSLPGMCSTFPTLTIQPPSRMLSLFSASFLRRLGFMA